jgi:hypothetical protein
MSPSQWPWTWEEEAAWKQELHDEEFPWMEELIDHMISDSLAASCYDPLRQQDDWSDEEILIPQGQSFY